MERDIKPTQITDTILPGIAESVRKTYVMPAIVYETELEARAGSPPGELEESRYLSSGGTKE